MGLISNESKVYNGIERNNTSTGKNEAVTLYKEGQEAIERFKHPTTKEKEGVQDFTEEMLENIKSQIKGRPMIESDGQETIITDIEER